MHKTMPRIVGATPDKRKNTNRVILGFFKAHPIIMNTIQATMPPNRKTSLVGSRLLRLNKSKAAHPSIIHTQKPSITAITTPVVPGYAGEVASKENKVMMFYNTWRFVSKTIFSYC